MKILMVTGDKNLLKSGTEANRRLELQRSVAGEIVVSYWGRGSLWPRIPPDPFEVVTVQDPFWRGLFAWRAARKLRARFNVQVHTDLSAQPLLRHVLAQIVLRRADSVRVVSEKIKEQVTKIRPRVPVQVLPIYVDLDRFRGVVRQPHEKKTILWIGRFEFEKDPELAISILRKVRQQIDAKLMMLGKGSLEEKLRMQAKDLPVEFPGWQDPVPYLQVADVVLSTSQHESWGASIVEALAAGVPVAAPEVGIAREAGANIASKEKLADVVIEVLKSGKKGELKLQLPTAREWAEQWYQSIVGYG